MEPTNFQTNSAPQSLPKENQIQDIHPDVVKPKSSAETSNQPILPGFQSTGSGIAPVGAINSLNFTANSLGWGLSPNGDAQFNGNHKVSTHFTPVAKFLGLTLYVSDGTTPDGNLTGATGDLCMGADNGKLYFCAGGTTWTNP